MKDSYRIPYYAITVIFWTMMVAVTYNSTAFNVLADSNTMTNNCAAIIKNENDK